MITYTCDMCGKEMNTEEEFADLKVVKVSQVLIPSGEGKNQLSRAITEKHYHFCPDCLAKILKLCRDHSAGK
jgi:uncharacterized CHY-type Zn-finger protein